MNTKEKSTEDWRGEKGTYYDMGRRDALTQDNHTGLPVADLRKELSSEFDDLIKTLQFPDKFYEILDRVIKREIDEEKAKHEKFVEELRSELLDFVFPDLMEKKKINEIIDKLSEKYK